VCFGWRPLSCPLREPLHISGVFYAFVISLLRAYQADERAFAVLTHHVIPDTGGGESERDALNLFSDETFESRPRVSWWREGRGEMEREGDGS